MKYETARVTCRRRVGDFEFDEVELSAGVEEKDVAVNVVKTMKGDALSGISDDGQIEMNLFSKEEKKEEKPKTTRSKKENKKPRGVSKKEEDARDKAEKEEKEKAKKEKKENKSKSKNTPYDRSDVKHKTLLSSTMSEEMGDKWASMREDNPQKTAAASKAMNGEDFIGADGEVLKDFIKKFKEYLD